MSKQQAALARFEPRSDSQRHFQKLYPHCDVLFALGPAGCGKTLAAVGLAAMDVLHGTAGRRKLVCVRPAVEADRSLGFLPGDLQEKLAPYTTPIKQALQKVSFRYPAELLSFEALAYTRGVTYEDAVVLLDEAQNASYHQLVLFLTRLGKNSKLLITGDPDQPDLRSTGEYHCDLEEVVEKLEGTPRVGVIDFPDTDSLRHPLISQLLSRLRR